MMSETHATVENDLRLGHITTNEFAYHTHSQLHQKDWNNAEIVDHEQFYKRGVKQAVHVRHTANFNQDEGLQLSPIWNDILC